MKLHKLALAAALFALSVVAFAEPAAAVGAPNSTATLMGTQNADSVAITGGSINNTTQTGTVSNSPTINSPTISGGTIRDATIAGAISPASVRTSSALTANATNTYGNVPGLSQTVVPGTYKFTLLLPSTVASGTGGIKYAFNYTGTVLSALESTSQGYTASAVAVQHTTTTTTQTDLFSQAAVVLFVQVEGTMVVTTGGTIDVQMAQNTSNVSNTVALVGGTFQLVRIA